LKTTGVEERAKVEDMINRTGDPIGKTGLYHCRQCEMVNLQLREGTFFPKCGRCLTGVRWVLC
jgi:hypothetical protein